MLDGEKGTNQQLSLVEPSNLLFCSNFNNSSLINLIFCTKIRTQFLEFHFDGHIAKLICNTAMKKKGFDLVRIMMINTIVLA